MESKVIVLVIVLMFERDLPLALELAVLLLLHRPTHCVEVEGVEVTQGNGNASPDLTYLTVSNPP